MALKSIFYPHVQSLGFELDVRRQPQFIDFLRFGTDALYVFDIQWDKYHKPRFVLNFGEASLEGVEFGGKHVMPAEICAAHCGSFLRLQRRRGSLLSSWFQLRRPVLEQLASFKRNYDSEVVANHVVQYFDEVETWWRSKKLGPHVQGF